MLENVIQANEMANIKSTPYSIITLVALSEKLHAHLLHGQLFYLT